MICKTICATRRIAATRPVGARCVCFVQKLAIDEALHSTARPKLLQQLGIGRFHIVSIRKRRAGLVADGFEHLWLLIVGRAQVPQDAHYEHGMCGELGFKQLRSPLRCHRRQPLKVLGQRPPPARLPPRPRLTGRATCRPGALRPQQVPNRGSPHPGRFPSTLGGITRFRSASMNSESSSAARCSFIRAKRLTLRSL